MGNHDGSNNLFDDKICYDINFIPTSATPKSKFLTTADSGPQDTTSPVQFRELGGWGSLSPLPIQMHNGEIVYSTNTELLLNQDFPLEARIFHIFPGLNKSL